MEIFEGVTFRLKIYFGRKCTSIAYKNIFSSIAIDVPFGECGAKITHLMGQQHLMVEVIITIFIMCKGRLNVMGNV